MCVEVSSSKSEPASSSPVRRRGEPWALGTVIGYSSATLFDKVALGQVDPYVGPFMRGVPSLLLGIYLTVRHKTFNQLQPSSPQFIGMRPILDFVAAGVISTMGLLLYYLAMAVGGITITAPVQETYVIWGTLLAWIMLRERIRAWALLGILLIFLGLVGLSIGQLHGNPLSPHWYWAIPLALATGLTYGISGVLWRDGQLRGAHQSVAILLQFVTSLGVAFGALLFAGRLHALVVAPPRALLALLASGVLSGILAIYCYFTALRLMAVARVYAYSALQPLVVTLLAHFLLKEFLNGLMLVGISLVSAGVILTQIFRPKDEQQV